MAGHAALDRRIGVRIPASQPKEWLAWSAVLLGAGVILALVRYEARDPDSALYATLAAELSRLPPHQWIAPEWSGNWGIDGLFREHPVGIFILPALLARLGYPALQAAYLVNALYQVLTIVLIQRLARTYVPAIESRSLGWVIQLLPIAFVYRVRANHEQAVLLFFLLALYATSRSRQNLVWALLTTFALVAMMLVKGVLMIFAPLACAWLLWLSRGEAGERQEHLAGPSASLRWAWVGLAGAVVVCLLVATGYEQAYRRVAGESFLVFYTSKWLTPHPAGDAVAGAASGLSVIANKLNNLLFYLGRLIWFAFPWSIAALIAAWANRHALLGMALGRPNGPSGSEATPPAFVIPAQRCALQGLALALGIAIFYIGALSLSDHKAERYMFPAYTVIGAAGGIAAILGSTRLRRVAERADETHPYLHVAIWFVAFCLALGSAWLDMPRPQFWPGMPSR